MQGCHVKPEQIFSLIWGYSDVYTEDLSGTVVGTTYLETGSVVPSGEVWVVQFLYVRDTTTAPGNLRLMLRDGVNTFTCGYDAAPVRYVPLIFTGAVPVAEGGNVQVYVGGATNGDNIDAGVWGYKMILTQ